jgi:DNA-binding CsgD family transcriptional regulator
LHISEKRAGEAVASLPIPRDVDGEQEQVGTGHRTDDRGEQSDEPFGRTVAAGDALLSPTITKRVIKQFARIPRPTAPKEFDELTTREQEVFRLIANGLSNAEIAQELYISDTTVKTHITHILQKLNLRDRVQAVVLAYQTGLFASDSQRSATGDESAID